MRTAYEIERDRQVNSIINGVFQEQSSRIPLTKKEYWEIECSEIERQIKKHIGIDVEIVPDGEMHNGYTPVSVSATDGSKDIKDYINGNQWAVGLYGWLEHLAFLNVIPEGDFLVDHSW
jgi:hypothetical protein